MAFVLKGEVEIDGRKAAITLRGVQQQATKTANTFKQSDASAQKLGKTLVGLGLNASKAGTSLGMLARLGTGGIFGYAVLGSMNKFGDAVKQASTDYYSAQKDLADAFETSFKSTSVEQARAGVEKTQDTIESLRGKITQLGATKGILKALEQFTGLDLGVKNTEDTLKDAQNNLKILEQVVLARIKERDTIKETSDNLKVLEKVSALNKSDIKMLELQGVAQDASVRIAFEELRTLDKSSKLLEEQLAVLNSITGAKKNQEAIDKTVDTLLDNKIKKAQLEYNLIKAQKDLQEKQSKQAQQAGGGLLGASRGGQQALEVARKQRARQLKTEDFKTQERVFGAMRDEENKRRAAKGLSPATMQDMRIQVAQQQAAGEMPSLANKLQAGATGGNVEQIARESAGGGKDTTDALIKAVQALVDTMKSGTVVK